MKPFLLFLTLWLSLQTASAQPQFPSPVVPQNLGINIHFTEPLPGEMELLAATGAKWIRMDWGWGRTEREKGVYDFSEPDKLVAALEKHKLRAIFILSYGNKLYSPVSPATPESRAAFARWAGAAAKRYAGRGILWEIWNEPNGNFWRPKPSPKDYVLLAQETAKAIRQNVPDSTIIGPATATFDWDFLEKSFQLGLLKELDAVSVHPYRNTMPETAAPDYKRLRELIEKYQPKDKNLPILCGEWGYTSQIRERDDETQARFLTRQWLVNLSQNIPLSIWYDWRDDGANPNEREHRFGMVREPYYANRTPVFDLKPAYFAAQTLMRELDGFSFAERISTGDDRDWILKFSRGENVVYAVWTTARQSRAALAPEARKFRAVSHLGEHLPDLQGAVTLGDAPIFLHSLP